MIKHHVFIFKNVLLVIPVFRIAMDCIDLVPGGLLCGTDKDEAKKKLIEKGCK